MCLLVLCYTGPPGVPINFKIDHRSSVSVWLSWEANLNGGSQQYFVVYHRAVDASDIIIASELIKDTGTSQTLEYKVTGLNESTEYEFKVMAMNGYDGNEGNTSFTGPERATTLGIKELSMSPISC